MNILNLWGDSLNSGTPNVLNATYSFGGTKSRIFVPTNIPKTVAGDDARALIHKSFIEMLKSGRDVKIVALKQSPDDESQISAVLVYTLVQSVDSDAITFMGINAHDGTSLATANASFASFGSEDNYYLLLEFEE